MNRQLTKEVTQTLKNKLSIINYQANVNIKNKVKYLCKPITMAKIKTTTTQVVLKHCNHRNYNE